MEMRRKDRLMPKEWAYNLLRMGEYGVLSTVGVDNLPYGVPISYVVLDNKIYFHSAKEGRKIANLNYCQQVSFVVVGRTQPVFTHNFTTYYESVIISGHIFVVTDELEKKQILVQLAAKYLPNYLEQADLAIDKSLQRTNVLGIEIEDITGKANSPKV